MIRHRIETLENRYHKPGTCPTCGASGASEDAITVIEVTVYGEGEPLGYYYEKPWPDKRRYPYPPDPRPVCPKCGQHIGDMLIITAFYDAAEWDALQRQSPAEG